MTTIATDDFNRSNSTGLGANWTPSSSGFNVVSNAAEADDNGVFVAYTALGAPDDDQWAQCVVPLGLGANRCGPCIRRTDANNMYLFILEGTTPTLYKKVAGGYTSLGSGGTAAAGDTLYLEAQGTALIAKLNGSTVVSTTDSSLTSGNCGIVGFTTGATVENFEYGDFGSIPAPIITNVDTDNTITSVQTNVVLTGVNIDAATFAIEQGANSVAQSIDSQNATTLQFDVVFDTGAGPHLKFGSAIGLLVNTDTQEDTIALTVTVPSGHLFVDLETLAITGDDRITAISDLAPGDQLHIRAVGGGAAPTGLSVLSDATFFYAFGSTPTSFQVRAFSAADSTWGAYATQTIPAPIEGDLAATETKDAAAISGKLRLVGALAATEAKDTLAVAVKMLLTGAFASAEAKDTLAASGSVRLSGVLGATEAKDALAASGVLRVSGSLVATEAKDTLGLDGDLFLTGALSATEAKDTLAAYGGQGGVLAVTEAKDTLASAGVLRLYGLMGATETKDAFAASAKLGLLGSLAATEAKDIAALTSSTTSTGNLVATEAKDACAAAGILRIRGALASTEARDILTAFETAPDITGALSSQDSQDVAAIAGLLKIFGAFFTTEAKDSTSISGDTALHGTLARIEAKDTASIAGGLRLLGSMIASEGAIDTAAVVGKLRLQGSLIVSEAKDTMAGSGSFPIRGVVVASEARDTLNVAGSAAIRWLRVTENRDQISVVAKIRIRGSLIATEAPDTLRASSPPRPISFSVQRPSFDSESFALAAFDSDSFSMLFGAYADVQLLSPGNLFTGYELDCTPFGGNIERYHNHNDGVIRWQGVDYYPWAIEAADFERVGDGQQPNPVLRLGNIGLDGSGNRIEGVVSALCLALDDLVGARVIRRRTFTHYLDDQPFADPTQEFPEEIWVIQQKTTETPEAVSFQLSSPLQFNNAELPSRQIIANLCSWLWIGGYRGPYCGYTGGAMFMRDGTPTSNPALDKCGGCLSDCKLRFGADQPLPYGGFPSADRAR